MSFTNVRNVHVKGHVMVCTDREAKSDKFLTCGTDGTVYVWDEKTINEREAIDMKTVADATHSCIAWNGKDVFIGMTTSDLLTGVDKRIVGQCSIDDIESCKQLFTFSLEVTSVDASQNYVVAGGSLLKCQLLTYNMKKRRLERSKRLLQRFTVARAREIVFSDEKIFPLNPIFNVQSERISGDSPADATAKGRLQESAKKPQSIMPADAIAKGRLQESAKKERLQERKSALIFLEAGLKINAAVCKEVPEKVLKPRHTSKVVQDWCDEQLPDFIAHDEWPPVLRILTRWITLYSSREALLKSWDEIDESYLQASCEAFVELLKDCVEAEGDHFGNC
ncbi:unnamed protein product [Heligmosomoides polygyrus]|uniref:WD_REPEATS_REGION domain-containing protein n=1 Tax=Heligmosomoides polygyrus TaxID=6339 RepID=A0A183FPZ6_HELPZ|nr:unnamed protein product [Heligmosomoides polygyrus]